MKPQIKHCWGLKWRSKNKLSGLNEYVTGVYPTRSIARREREMRFGYIRTRPDLQSEPHGWKVPAVVRLKITTEVV